MRAIAPLALYDLLNPAPGVWRVKSAVTAHLHPETFVSQAAADAWAARRYGRKVAK